MRLPPDVVPVIYITPVPRLVTGHSGRRYHVKPNLILLDVYAPDAKVWIAAKQARHPLPTELTTFDGYLAQQA